MTGTSPSGCTSRCPQARKRQSPRQHEPPAQRQAGDGWPDGSMPRRRSWHILIGRSRFLTSSDGRCLDQNHRGGCDRQTTRGPPQPKTLRNCSAGAKLRRVESHERCRVQKPAKRRQPAARGLERRAETDAPANAPRRAANRRKMTEDKRHCLFRQAKNRKSERMETRGFGSTE